MNPTELPFWEERIRAARRKGRPAGQAVYHADGGLHDHIVTRSKCILDSNTRKGDRVLDLGCGAGSLANCFGREIQYLGVDLVPEFVEEATRNYPDRTFLELDFTKPRALKMFGDGYFDVIFGRGIEYLGKIMGSTAWTRLLLECLRVAPKVVLFSPHHTSPRVIQLESPGRMVQTCSYVPEEANFLADGKWVWRDD